MTDTHTFVLPSGVECEIEELDGRDKADFGKGTAGMVDILTRRIVRIGQDGKPN